MANPLICVFNPVTSLIDEVQSVSLGPTVVGVPIVTNVNGVIDSSLLSLGNTATAGQALTSGTLVNLYSAGGTLHAQIASAQNGGGSPPAGPYPLAAQGFAATSVSSSAPVTVSFFGTFKYIDGNSEFAAINIGQEVFLSDRGDGSPTLTPPSGVGELEQSVGYVVAFVSPNVVTINFTSGFQDFSHISGVNPITKGGTGATTGSQALINLIGGSPTTGQALVWNGSAWVPGTDLAGFNQITSGSNVTATMTVSTGATLTFSGTGVVNANQIQGFPIASTTPLTGQALVWNGSAWAPSNAAVTAFNDITAGTNTAALVVGSGGSLTVSGSGVIEATQIWNVLVSSTPPTAGQTLAASSPTAAAWATPTVSFDNVTSGTNAAATMTVGSGASIVTTGTGVVEATELATTGAAVVVRTAAPPTIGQALVATSPTAASWQSVTTTPGGVSGDVQYNLSGAFAGDAGLTWDPVSGSFQAGGQPAGVSQLYNLNGGQTNIVLITATQASLNASISGSTASLTADADVSIFSSNGSVKIENGVTGKVIEVPFNSPSRLAFFGVTPVVQPTVTGSRNGNPGLASLLTALSNEGLVVDSTTAGSNLPSVVASTSQKSETAADPSVLSFTPPATAGSYRLRFVLSVSAAAAATGSGWTATWTDSNGNAQTPGNLSLFLSGTALPALAYTITTPGNYYGSIEIDVNNSATPIVIQFTFTGGTIAALASANIEQLI